MSSFNGNRVTQRGGAGAGRGDNPHPAPSFKQYPVKDGGGDYLHVSQGSLSDEHSNVSRFSNTGELKYSTQNARFQHNADTNKMGWSGGTDHGGLGGRGELETF